MVRQSKGKKRVVETYPLYLFWEVLMEGEARMTFVQIFAGLHRTSSSHIVMTSEIKAPGLLGSHVKGDVRRVES